MRHQTLICVAGALVAAAPPLSAQDSVRASGAACSYDTCALRMEDNRILRGSGGARVGHLGFLGATRLSPLVVSSDSARHYAAEFDREYGPGAKWAALGGAGFAVTPWLVFTRNRQRNDWGWGDREWVLLGGFVVSGAVAAYGNHRLRRARRAVARAIWWNNRELPATR